MVGKYDFFRNDDSNPCLRIWCYNDCNMPVFKQKIISQNKSLTGLLAHAFHVFFSTQVARTFLMLSLLQLALPKLRVVCVYNLIQVACRLSCTYVGI